MPTPRPDIAELEKQVALLKGRLSAQERTEAELRASEEKYRQLVDNAQEAVYVIQNGVFRFVNPMCATLTGYPQAELLGKSMYDFVPESKRDRVREHHHRILEDGESVAAEAISFVSRSGEQRWLLVSAVRIEWEGRPATLNFASDITERRRTEESLILSEMRFRALIENAPDGIVLVHPQKGMIFASPAARRMFGYGPEVVITLDPNTHTHPDDLAMVLVALDDLMRNPAQMKTLQYRFRRQDGSWLWIESCFTNLIEVPGIEAIVMNFRNIEDRKRAEAEQQRLQQQLVQAQKLESIGRLAGGVAHDFNNLLMSIMNYVELCREHVGKEQPIRGWLDEVTSDAERSAALTRQLLAFARRQPIAPRIVDFNDAVAGLLTLLRRLIGEDINLVWMPGASLWPVKVDPSQIDQILANLCVNARDAISGAGRISIETGNTVITSATCADHADAVPGEYVRLSVRDSGCGMKPEVLAHAFEPFFTTKAVGEGTGLGLATVYGIVRQNGGFIDVNSEPGTGTTFLIYLPRFAGAVAVASAEGVAALPQGRGETILLVEDEKSLRVTCSLFLRARGYNVLVAENPAVALELAGRHPGAIQLLVTDVVMPGMDGRQLSERLAATRPGMKCLFMSGYTADVISHRGVLDQGIPFLEKPFSRDELVRRVREALEP